MFFIVWIAVVFLLAAAAVGVYLSVYNRNINRKIHGGDGGKPMYSPGQIALVAIAAGIMALFLLLWATQSWSDAHPTEWDIKAQGSFFVSAFDAETAESEWTSIYSPEENEGYTKRVVRDGNFAFTVFECESDYDGLHPDFLIYARYLGDKDVANMTWDGNYLLSNGEIFCGTGFDLEPTGNVLVVGSASESIDFRLTVRVYDDAGWQKYADAVPDDEASFAADSGTVTLSLDPYHESN